jgi:DNA recombination protein RmuC
MTVLPVEIGAAAAAAFLVGAALAWAATRSVQARLEERYFSVERRAVEAEARSFDLDSKRVAAERDAAALRATLEESKTSQTNALEALLERAKNELRDATAARAGERVEQLVKPLHQKLTEFDAIVREVEKQRVGHHEGMKEQITGLLQRTEKLETAANALTTQTSSLASALRDPRARGRWGEIQLRKVLEMAGMLDYCDFGEQQTVLLDEGRGRPDVTVNLPGNRRIFVDAKVPLDRFLDSLEAGSEDARHALLREHAKLLRDHVILLGRRGYAQADGSAELVVMFVPGEGSLSAALHEDPALIENALDNGVLVASPLTLIALLRSYALGWQAVRQEENAERIAAVAHDLYDAVRIFAEHLARLGETLGKSVETYNKAVGSLERNVLPKGRKIKELGSLADDELAPAEPLTIEVRQITAIDARASKGSA